MKLFFRPLFLSILAGTSVLVAACNSKSDVYPSVATTQTGSLSGQVLPPLSASSIIARSYTTGQELTVVPAANGDFLFKDISVGKWNINVQPAPGYNWQDTRDAQTMAGKTVSVGTTLLETNSATSGWWLLDGKYYGFCAPAVAFQPNVLSFSCNGYLSNKTMLVTLVGIDGRPSSFRLGNGNNSSSITFNSTNQQGVPEQWTTVGGSGEVVITVYQANPRRVSGTFTCLAVPANSSTTASKQISGRFSNIYYQ